MSKTPIMPMPRNLRSRAVPSTPATPTPKAPQDKVSQEEKHQKAIESLAHLEYAKQKADKDKYLKGSHPPPDTRTKTPRPPKVVLIAEDTEDSTFEAKDTGSPAFILDGSSDDEQPAKRLPKSASKNKEPNARERVDELKKRLELEDKDKQPKRKAKAVDTQASKKARQGVRTGLRTAPIEEDDVDMATADPLSEESQSEEHEDEEIRGISDNEGDVVEKAGIAKGEKSAVRYGIGVLGSKVQTLAKIEPTTTVLEYISPSVRKQHVQVFKPKAQFTDNDLPHEVNKNFDNHFGPRLYQYFGTLRPWATIKVSSDKEILKLWEKAFPDQPALDFGDDANLVLAVQSKVETRLAGWRNRMTSVAHDYIVETLLPSISDSIQERADWVNEALGDLTNVHSKPFYYKTIKLVEDRNGELIPKYIEKRETEANWYCTVTLHMDIRDRWATSVVPRHTTELAYNRLWAPLHSETQHNIFSGTTQPKTRSNPTYRNTEMSNPALFLLPASEKFDGSNWLEWKTTILNAAKAKGLLGYINGTNICPAPPDPDDTPAPATAYWGSSQPTFEEWLQRDAYAQGMITLNVVNPVGQGVVMSGTSAESWASLAAIRDAQTDIGLINAEEKLAGIKYTEGGDIEKHFAEMREAWSKANGQGAEISDRKFRTYLLKSMPKSWSVLVGSLLAEKTSADIITRITTHAMIVGSSPDVSPAKATHALSAQANSGGKRPVRHPELKCTNLPSCGRTGHTADQCFRPGGGLAGQYPDWWRGSKTGATTTPSTTPAPVANSAAISATNPTSDSPRYLAFSAIDQRQGSQPISYADSAASRHFFVERADFETYESVSGVDETGTTASGGGFEIKGKGTVRKFVEFDGCTVELTFADALHTPKLEHNLLSIGCLGKKGCSVTFNGLGAIFFDPDGHPFMRGACHNDTMYRIDFIPRPTAMSARSLKRPTDLETWHRRLGHVGENTLRMMEREQMVTGLDITKKSVNGRCENCIMGKQTRRPFDEEVIPEHAPNDRVSFDLEARGRKDGS
ncbi:hypothetical protein D9615_006849 [Tricholomella constricta]|uniref:GAG-pre-integrase domain-containing protein n=1 Tax=Tricholomella constricta TaxID=117010 RepID=A0A8H5H8Z5_9AGAR|nr:hypothetical protein D9615_006849 [Tricholomella constricta]